MGVPMIGQLHRYVSISTSENGIRNFIFNIANFAAVSCRASLRPAFSRNLHG